MSVPIRTAALVAIAARLTSEMTGVVVERARRVEIDLDTESLPRLMLVGTDWSADETAEPMMTHYTMGFSVDGYVGQFPRGTSDAEVEDAVSMLHARVVAALAGWTPAESGLQDVAEQDADFQTFDAEDSARQAASFTARFTMLITAARGNPYSP